MSEKRIYNSSMSMRYSYNEISNETADSMINDKNTYMFRVNVPYGIEEFERGNGEGMWAIATSQKDESIIKNDSSIGERVVVKLLNKSVYYKDLNWGDYILVKTRGSNRPIAIINDLEELGRISEDERLAILKRVAKNNC